MQWYNILARILLMLSVIDFALAAPVVVREHDSMADNGIAVSPLRPDPSWSANAVDQINAPPIPRSSDSGDWWEQEPGYHNPRSRTDSIGSPEPSNPANNPPSLSPPAGPGSTPPLPTSQAPTDETDPLKLNPSSPHDDTHSDSTTEKVYPTTKFKSASELTSAPTHDTPPPDGSPQITSSSDESYSSSSWEPTDSDSGTTSSWSSQHISESPPAGSPGSSQDHIPSPLNLGNDLPSDTNSLSSDSTTEKVYPTTKFKPVSELMSAPTHDTPPPDGSPKTASSSDESYSSSSRVPTDSDPGSTSSWSSLHVSPPASSPGSSQDRVSSPLDLGNNLPSDTQSLASDSTTEKVYPTTKFKPVSELVSAPTHDTPPPDGSPKTASSSDESYSSSSRVPTDSDSGSMSSSSSQHVSPPSSSPGSSQDRVSSPLNLGNDLPSDTQSLSSDSTTEKVYPTTKFKPVSELMTTTTYDTPSSDESYSSSSWAPSDSDSDSTSSWSSASSLDQSSTDESHLLTPGPTDNQPLPASLSNTGPSTEPNPPLNAKRPRPEEHDSEFESLLSKIPKGKFKRRFSGPGAVH